MDCGDVARSSDLTCRRSRFCDGAFERNRFGATIRCYLQADCCGTFRLAKDGDVFGVASEQVDVLLYPLQAKSLIQ